MKLLPYNERTVRAHLPARSRGILLVSLANKKTKPPIWYPGGWLIATHDRGVSLGWSIGPKTKTAFDTFAYAKTDYLKLPAHPSDAIRAAMDLLDGFRDDRPKRPAWVGILYLPKTQVGWVVP